jgi:hypothetical protein
MPTRWTIYVPTSGTGIGASVKLLSGTYAVRLRNSFVREKMCQGIAKKRECRGLNFYP